MISDALSRKATPQPLSLEAYSGLNTRSQALAGSGVEPERLKAVSSTTFGAQLGIAEGVARENPHLYFEIQSLNAHNGPALTALDDAVHTLLAAVRNGDEQSFVALMQRGRDYLHAGAE